MARRVGSVTAPVECTGHETAASVCQDRATPIDAVVFDLDGVITDTARTHASAWKATFDVFLNSMSSFSTPQAEFDASADYVRYVDGKLRIEGIASFLRSRHIELPLGQPDDTALTSVYGIGNISCGKSQGSGLDFINCKSKFGLTLQAGHLGILNPFDRTHS